MLPALYRIIRVVTVSPGPQYQRKRHNGLHNRRQFARVEVKWPATIITTDGPFVGETIDISHVGLSIYCKELLPIGQEFRLELQPPNC